MMVAEKTGWTKSQIIHDHSFAELNFMIVDSPKLTRKKPTPKTFDSDEDMAAWFGTTIE